MSHFQLRELGSSTTHENLELQGTKTIYISPISHNLTNLPKRSTAVVDILGKKSYIELTHRVREVDPEPAIPKWSYINNLYSDYDPDLVPVDEETSKGIQACYVFANPGYVNYTGTVDDIQTSTEIAVSESFTDEVKARGRASQDTTGSSIHIYNPNAVMELCTFKMFYKSPIVDVESGGTILPTDINTPESHRQRLPCNVVFSSVPSWISNVQLTFIIQATLASDDSIQETTYNTWASFREAWEIARLNTTDYSDVIFYGRLTGTISTNSNTSERSVGTNTIVLQEIAGDDNKIWGAKPLYLYIGQLAGYKRILLFYKKATTQEVTVRGAAQDLPGTAQINGTYHKLWFDGESCGIAHDDQGPDTITLNKLTCRAKANDAGQDHLDLSYQDTSKNRTEYFYVGNPFFLGFVEDTNLYKESIGINLFDNRNTINFWHNLYFTGTAEKCTYDPEWFNVGEMPHLYQGDNPLSISNVGYTILFPWAVNAGGSWKSIEEIPTAYTDAGLVDNSHRILAQNWITRAETGDPGLSKDTVKSTAEVRYGGGVSISNVTNRDQTNGTGWNFNPDMVNNGSGSNRLHNYLEYVAQKWDNDITAFGSPSELRDVREILFVPIFVTSHKLCDNDPINSNNINAMTWGASLIPDIYKSHQGYAPYIGIFPPTVTYPT